MLSLPSYSPMNNNFFSLLTQSSDIDIISTRICKYCWDIFPVTSIEKDLLDNQRMKYPEQCWTCTFRMLYSYINDKQLYHRKDTEDWKSIISVMSENYDWPVLEAEKYKKMMIDDVALKYARPIWEDIFLEFKKLYATFPKFSRMTYPALENASYSSHVGWSKNLYLSFCVFENCEDIYYSYRILWNCKNIFSSLDVSGSSQVYSSRMVANSHDISFCSNIFESTSLIFCTNMQNSSECFLCCNQVNAKYKILNTQYSEGQYKKMRQEIAMKITTPEWMREIEKRYKKFLEDTLVEPAINIQNSEKIAGDNIYYSKNNINSFKWIGNYNTVNTILTWNHNEDKMVYLINSIEAWQICENCIGCCSFWGNIQSIFFCNTVSECNHCYYCIDIQQCEECMFSVGLRNKKYCILNKEYSKEEYFRLKEQIILRLIEKSQWGEFLWFDISTFPYNDTSGYDFFKVHTVIFPSWEKKIIDPFAQWIVTVFSDSFISDAELDLGGTQKIPVQWRTKEKEINIPLGMTALYSTEIGSIDKISEDILEKAIICEETKRPFRIIQDELQFLKNKWFALPIIHHEVRREKLLQERPIWQLFLSVCDNCHKEMLSVFKTRTVYKVFCSECYRNFMFK